MRIKLTFSQLESEALPSTQPSTLPSEPKNNLSLNSQPLTEDKDTATGNVSDFDESSPSRRTTEKGNFRSNPLYSPTPDKVIEIESSKSSSNGSVSNQDITSPYGLTRMTGQRTFLGTTHSNNNNTSLYNSIRNTLKVNCGVSILQKQTYISPKNSNLEEKRLNFSTLVQKTAITTETKTTSTVAPRSGTSIEDVRKLIQSSCTFFQKKPKSYLFIVGQQKSFLKEEPTAVQSQPQSQTDCDKATTTTLIPDFTKVISDYNPLIETVKSLNNYSLNIILIEIIGADR